MHATIVRMTSATGQAEMMLVPRARAPIGLVLFMHGLDSDQNQLLADGNLFPVRDALLAAGYAIMTSDAHGNNAGNPASVQDQFDAYSDAEAVLHPPSLVNILGFSMGGLDALLIAEKRAIPGLHSLALVSPATDQQPFLRGRFAGTVTAAFSASPSAGTLNAVKAWDPILAPATNYRGYHYAFWHSPDDTTVPYTQSTHMSAHLAAAGINAPVYALTGNHGTLSALKPADVVTLFATTP